MTSALTVAFSGTSSVLQNYFIPEIFLCEEYDYCCTFLDLIIKKTDINLNLSEIFKSSIICIDCDIISDSYINSERKHTIHQFASDTSHITETTFVEFPKHLNYFPLKTKHLRSIQISIVDNTGKQVDFHGVDIICRINIRRDNKKFT